MTAPLSPDEMRVRFADDPEVIAFLDKHHPVPAPVRTRCVRFADCTYENDILSTTFWWCHRCVKMNGSTGGEPVVEEVRRRARR